MSTNDDAPRDYLPFIAVGLLVLVTLAVGATAASADDKTPPVEKWLYQDLQNHFEKKGLKCYVRKNSKRPGQWFMFKKIDDQFGELFGSADYAGPYWHPRIAHVERRANADDAKSAATRIRDEDQKPALAWHQFLIRAQAPLLKEIAKALSD